MRVLNYYLEESPDIEAVIVGSNVELTFIKVSFTSPRLLNYFLEVQFMGGSEL